MKDLGRALEELRTTGETITMNGLQVETGDLCVGSSTESGRAAAFSHPNSASEPACWSGLDEGGAPRAGIWDGALVTGRTSTDSDLRGKIDAPGPPTETQEVTSAPLSSWHLLKGLCQGFPRKQKEDAQALRKYEW